MDNTGSPPKHGRQPKGRNTSRRHRARQLQPQQRKIRCRYDRYCERRPAACHQQRSESRIENDSPPKEGKCQESSSFLKKRTKKLLFSLIPDLRIYSANQHNQKFFVSFFQKRNTSLLRFCLMQSQP
jgi:hypothetical protein